MNKSELKMVSIGDITISTTNPRKTFDLASLDELKESIKQHGILQPILIRPIVDGFSSKMEQQYELVCGERRFRAAKKAKLKDLPCNIRELSDDEAFELQIIENLERKDVHPMEEAEAFKRMIDSEKYSISDIAAKIVKTDTYVAQRLKFVELIDELKQDFYDNKFGVGHAVLLARLDPDTQLEMYNDSQNGYQYEGYGTLSELKRNIEGELYSLDDAPFDMNDDTFPAVSSCLVCPKRSGFNPTLFPDVEAKDTCFDRICYSKKTNIFVERQVAKIINDADDTLIGIGWNVKAPDFIQELCKQHSITIFSDSEYRIPWSTELDKLNKKRMLIVAGRDVGKYKDVVLHRTSNAINGSSEEVVTTNNQISKIEERAKRSLELDNVKIFQAIKEVPKIYESYTDDDSELSELETKAMWFLFKKEVAGWEVIDKINKLIDCPNSYNDIKEFEFYKTIGFDALQINRMVRMAIKSKLSQMNEPNFEACTRSKFFFEIIKEKFPTDVEIIVHDQEGIAAQRIERTDAKIEKLKDLLKAEK